jgi:hypothetical protein
MFLTYGGYAHAIGEAEILIKRSSIFNEGGQLYGLRENWTVRGFLQAPDPVTLTLAMEAMKVAYSFQGQDLALRFDDGSLTTHYIQTAATIGGVRVVDGPSFPQGHGAEYSTFRSYEITLEAEVPNTQVNLMAYFESLTFEGGGPLNVHLQTLTGLPQKQLTAEATPFRCIQDGEAIGHFSYPFLNPPIFAYALVNPRGRFEKKTPKRTGPPGRPTFTEWPVHWHYEFESAYPFVGDPTPWLG